MKYKNLNEAIFNSRKKLLEDGEIVETENWQGDKSPFKFIEILNLNFKVPMENDLGILKEECKPFLPWVDEHFEERIGGEPLNPPPSHKQWLKGNEKFMEGDKFSHSYPERIWSKGLHHGIRYEIGDLNDAVELLKKDRFSRQCYIPIWFPEDINAAKQNKRVPCTLGWHILIRGNLVHCHYPMRSCDAIRHFQNDLYFANRLVLWIISQLSDENLKAGELMFSSTSFHCFDNDKYYLTQILK